MKLKLSIKIDPVELHNTLNFINHHNTIYKALSDEEWLALVKENLMQDVERIALRAFDAGRKFQLKDVDGIEVSY